MTIDMSQFKQTFLEESYEGLDTIENTLVNLDVANANNEDINLIFRAAHSIKGGSATFGFNELTDLTHVMETLLDEVRNGQRTLTQEIVKIFLESVDCLRQLLNCYQQNSTPDPKVAKEIEIKLNEFLESSEVDNPEIAGTKSAKQSGLWQIKFKPNKDILLTGNEPLRLIRDLIDLGESSEVKINTEKLPNFVNFHPDHCYISWDININGEISKEDIEEIFEWVIDECELEISSDIKTDNEPKQDSKPNVEVVTETPKPSSNKDGKTQTTTSIRVDIDKIDALLNMVGELVITQSMLSQIGSNFSIDKLSKLTEGIELLNQNTRELQESVMKIRMLPINFIFNRVPRMVFDLSRKLDKNVDLQITGEQTELDKTVMEKLSDPLVHLVRNSLDHGIETPDVRKAKGKPEQGVLKLNAYHQGGNIIIEIIDDGAGINKEKVLAKAIKNGLCHEGQIIPDEQIIDLLFQPGFSTAETISDVSGRGVGMDVVKKNIEALGGSVEVKSVENEGSTFTIQLPLTLSILDGQLVRIGKEIFIIPLVSIIESIQIEEQYLETITSSSEVYKLRNDYVPIAKLDEIFNIESDNNNLIGSLMVIVEHNHHKVGILVDELLSQQQVVIKSLETNYKKVKGVSGATILGDGTVSLIVDIAELQSIISVDNTNIMRQAKSA